MPSGNSPLGANFDPDSPYMQMNQEAEISTASVPDSVFQIPEVYQEVAASELLKGRFTQQFPTPRVPSRPEFVQAYLNRNFILRHLGDQSTVKLKKSELSRVTGTCDIAVQVTKADWSAGVARFGLEYIGGPSVTGRARGNCNFNGPSPAELEISGFSPDEDLETVMTSVAQILPTSEQYLAAEGIAFNVSAEEDASSPQGRSAKPRVLLKVDAGSTDAARRARVQGDVTINVVIGVDGHAHEPRITQGIGYGVDENALRALSMWLFEPARRDGKPVPLSSTIEMNFRLL
jgi:TonB family protein